MAEFDREELAGALMETLSRVMNRYDLEKVHGHVVMDAVVAFVGQLIAAAIVDNEMTPGQRHTLLAALHTKLDASIEAHLTYFQREDVEKDDDPRRLN